MHSDSEYDLFHYTNADDGTETDGEVHDNPSKKGKRRTPPRGPGGRFRKKAKRRSTAKKGTAKKGTAKKGTAKKGGRSIASRVTRLEQQTSALAHNDKTTRGHLRTVVNSMRSTARMDPLKSLPGYRTVPGYRTALARRSGG
jgi:hypothetical protein